MGKKIVTFFVNWGTVILFVTGLALIALSGFLIQPIVGFLVTGIELLAAAYTLDREMSQRGGDQ